VTESTAKTHLPQRPNFNTITGIQCLWEDDYIRFWTGSSSISVSVCPMTMI